MSYTLPRPMAIEESSLDSVSRVYCGRELDDPLASPPDDASRIKHWTIGTLTYTLGGLTLLFFWLLLGDFALSVRDRSVGPVAQLFLSHQGSSDTVMAVLLSSLPLGLGMILGPIISYRSDRYRSRWGRRIPFLIPPTMVAGLAMTGIAFCPYLGEVLQGLCGGRFSLPACTIAMFGALWTIFELAVVISSPIFGALINDVVPRPVLGRFFAMFRAVSLLDGMIFQYFLLQRAESHFQAIFIAIAGVFGVGFMLMCLMVREGQYPPVQSFDGTEPERLGFVAATKRYFRECYSHPHYWWIFAAGTLGTVAFLPLNLYSLVYARQLNISMAYYGKLTAASYLVSLCLAYPLGSLVDRFHCIRVGLVTMAMYVVSTAWAMIAVRNAATFGVALVTHTILSGTFMTATAPIGNALLPRSKFGQFTSASGIVKSLATMCVGPATGLLLDGTNHNYRLTFTAGFILSCLTIVTMFIVYHRFMAMGGPEGYVAPGEEIVVIRAEMPALH